MASDFEGLPKESNMPTSDFKNSSSMRQPEQQKQEQAKQEDLDAKTGFVGNGIFENENRSGYPQQNIMVSIGQIEQNSQPEAPKSENDDLRGFLDDSQFGENLLLKYTPQIDLSAQNQGTEWEVAPNILWGVYEEQPYGSKGITSASMIFDQDQVGINQNWQGNMFQIEARLDNQCDKPAQNSPQKQLDHPSNIIETASESKQIKIQNTPGKKHTNNTSNEKCRHKRMGNKPYQIFQLELLEKQFAIGDQLTNEERDGLVEKTGLTLKQVGAWFSNRKWRRKEVNRRKEVKAEEGKKMVESKAWLKKWLQKKM
uniref:Homeobox domain-containing protein n=1 Tax=Caenorhabditis tropicalis TaxID=1561998 RepID=A0A1I7U1Y0_9PELO